MKRQRRLQIDLSRTRSRLNDRSKEATLVVGQQVDTQSLSSEQSPVELDVSVQKEQIRLKKASELSSAARATEELKKQAQNQPVLLNVKFHENKNQLDSTVIVNPSLVPGAKPGDVGQIESLNGSSKKLCFVFTNFESSDNDDQKNNNSTVANRFVNPSIGNNNSSGNNNNTNNANNNVNSNAPKENNFVSIELGPIPSIMELKFRSQVQVKLKTRDSVEVDTVELYIKDLHLSRGDMWNISNNLLNYALYRNQKLSFLKGSIRANVQRIYKNGHKVFSGIVGKETKFVFRSQSARLIVFLQISSEMWHFEESGEQMFHKLVNSLFPKAFNRWKESGTHHLITIILFSSIDQGNNDSTTSGRYSAGELPQNKKNYYRVVVDQVSILLWNDIMSTLRLEFANFKRDISLQKNPYRDEKHTQEYIIEGEILPAVKGNLLEAINLAMSLVVDDFKDPDLKQTTNHFIFITPGTGIYDVSYDMLIRTSKLLSTVDSSIDIICLSKPPLHIVPLFRYMDPQNKLKFCIPSWMDISFWSDASQAVQQWLPRAKIYDLQMMGVMETDLPMVSTNDLILTHYRSMNEAMEMYDSMAFKSPLKSNNDSLLNKKPEFIKKVSSFNEKFGLITPSPSLSDNESDAASQKNRLKPANDFLSVKTSQATTSNVVGVTTQSKSNVSAFSALLSLSKKTEIQPASSNPLNFVRKMISTPLLNAQLGSSNSAGSSNSSINESPLDAKSTNDNEEEDDNDSGRHMSVDTLRSSNTNRSSISVEVSKNQRNRKLPKKVVANKKPKKETEFNGYWTNIDNPSHMSMNEIQNMITYGRWKYVFPPKVKRKTVKWTSLTSPAALPLTTPLFPSLQDFNQNFTFRIYDIFLNQSSDQNENFTSFTLLKNMISIRLSLGFQICAGDIVSKVENQRKPNGDAKLLVQNINKSNYLGSRMYLIMGNEIHRLSCDFNGLVNVQVYRRITNTNELEILQNEKEYFEQIRSRYSEDYLSIKIKNNVSNLRNYNWNSMDQAVAGYDDSSSLENNRKRYHRLKFVILPTDIPQNSFQITNENLTPEEIRLEGIRTLIMNINKIRFKSSYERKNSSNKKVEITPEINFYTGGLFKYLKQAYKSFTNEERMNSIMFSTPKYTKTINMDRLAAILQSDVGVEMVDRVWHMRLHRNSILGMELVSWLIENFQDIDTREEAVEFGNYLMEQQLIQHAASKHSFLDGYYFYLINKRYSLNSPNVQIAIKQLRDEEEGIKRKTSIHSGKTDHQVEEDSSSLRARSGSNVPSFKLFKSNNTNTTGNESINNSIHHHNRNQSLGSSNLEDDSNIKSVVLSREILVDLDPDHVSWQQELIKVHYDIVHNPDHCFHIRIEWLSTTCKLIDDVVQNWAKHCDRFGLSLVQIPWEELFTLPIRNPLHSTVDIKLALNPWEDSEFNQLDVLTHEKYFYHLFLLEKSGFMLDNRTANYFQDDYSKFDVSYSWGKPMFKYAQFIHFTGAYIAELRDNGKFFLAPNNAHISRLNLNIELQQRKGKAIYFDSQSVMLDFRQTCNNEDKLREIFRLAYKNYQELKLNEQNDDKLSKLVIEEDLYEEIV